MKLRPSIFQIMNYVRANKLSFKYQVYTNQVTKILGWEHLSLWQKAQFLCQGLSELLTLKLLNRNLYSQILTRSQPSPAARVLE